MPPAPTGDTISYGPSLVPEVSAIDARNYSPYALQRMRPIPDGWSANLTLGLLHVSPSSVILAIAGVFTPVLAKHSKSFSLIVCISVGSTECRATSSRGEGNSRRGRGVNSPTVTAKVVIYEAFVDGKLEAPKHLSWSWIPFRNSSLRQSWTRIWKLCLSGAHPQHRAMRTRYDLIRRG
jgi:hypothetical protein